MAKKLASPPDSSTKVNPTIERIKEATRPATMAGVIHCYSAFCPAGQGPVRASASPVSSLSLRLALDLPVTSWVAAHDRADLQCSDSREFHCYARVGVSVGIDWSGSIAVARWPRPLIHPNFHPDNWAPGSPAASRSVPHQSLAMPMSTEVGTQGDASRQCDICPISLIMLRSQVRFLLAPHITTSTSIARPNGLRAAMLTMATKKSSAWAAVARDRAGRLESGSGGRRDATRI